MKTIYIVTLFPEMFDGVLKSSMLWKATKENAVRYELVNLREFGLGPRKTVDDTPYGGGDGMLLMIEPLVRAIEFIKTKSPESIVILPTPRGEIYKQSNAKQLAADQKDLIFLCPRYEGYDERVVDWVDIQYRIGNYVLTGGELPVMVMLDSIVRLLPGVLGGEQSVELESFQDDDSTVEYPQYTRPEVFNDKAVPSVLLSGNHAEIEKWRKSHQQKTM